MTAGPALAPDAAMVLGIASTAMPFARTSEDEAERWLRVLRLHGEVGITLQALGVGEQPLAADGPAVRDRTGAAEVDHRDAVAHVAEHAARIARWRGAAGVGTVDLLMAVMDAYGEDFDRVLRAHGTTGEEVLERLDGGLPPHTLRTAATGARRAARTAGPRPAA
jgi:hypothetical protein